MKKKTILSLLLPAAAVVLICGAGPSGASPGTTATTATTGGTSATTTSGAGIPWSSGYVAPLVAILSPLNEMRSKMSYGYNTQYLKHILQATAKLTEGGWTESQPAINDPDGNFYVVILGARSGWTYEPDPGVPASLIRGGVSYASYAEPVENRDRDKAMNIYPQAPYLRPRTDPTYWYVCTPGEIDTAPNLQTNPVPGTSLPGVAYKFSGVQDFTHFQLANSGTVPAPLGDGTGGNGITNFQTVLYHIRSSHTLTYGFNVLLTDPDSGAVSKKSYYCYKKDIYPNTPQPYTWQVKKVRPTDAAIDTRVGFQYDTNTDVDTISSSTPPVDYFNFGNWTYKGGLFVGAMDPNGSDKSGYSRIQMWFGNGPVSSKNTLSTFCAFYMGMPVNVYGQQYIGINYVSQIPPNEPGEDSVTWNNRWDKNVPGNLVEFSNVWFAANTTTPQVNDYVNWVLPPKDPHITQRLCLKESYEAYTQAPFWRYFASREFANPPLTYPQSDAYPRVWMLDQLSP